MEFFDFILTPDQWIMSILAIIVAIFCIFSLRHSKKRLSDKTMTALFLVYSLYQIIYYSYLAYYHIIFGGPLPADSAVSDSLHFIARVKDYYLVIVMCYLVYKSTTLPSQFKEGGMRWKLLYRLFR